MIFIDLANVRFSFRCEEHTLVVLLVEPILFLEALLAKAHSLYKA